MSILDFFRQAPKPEKRRPAPTLQMRSITQAAQTGRLESSWGVTPTTADAQIYQEWTAAVARSRKAAEDYDHFKKFIQLVRDNVAGPDGFNLNAQIRDPGGTIDTLASSAIENAFDSFSKKGNFDVTGTLSRSDAERLCLSTWGTDGEVIVVAKYGKKYAHGVAFQFIDPVRLDPTMYHKLANGNVIRHGIEMDEDNRPVAYHFKDYTEMQVGYVTSHSPSATIRVPAENVIHWFVPEKIGQKRGLPPGRTALWRMRMLSGFEDAAVTNARIGAAKMGFFKDPDASEDDDDPLELDAEPGTFEDIGNREMQAWNPQFPDQSIEPFVKALVRSVGAGLNVSYHNLANDLTSVNFSSIRQGALDEREVWKGLQNSFQGGVVIPIFERWLESALLNQIILVPTSGGPGKPLKFERIEKYKAVAFTGRRWPWIDPASEQSANEKAVAQGFKSRSEVIRETSNRQPEDVWDELEREREELNKRGIVPLIPSGSVPPDQGKPETTANA
jgi:lambda family phage portal protein